jgi:uncharacterized RDD family membrane protein YckC
MSAGVGENGARAMQGHNAGFVTRASANIIDGLVIAIMWVGLLAFAALIRYVAHPLRGFRLPALETWVSGLIVCVIAILYFTVTWGGTGRSVGKRMAGLRLTGRDGRPIGAARALPRAALCVVFPIGFLWLLFSRRNRSLYDNLLATDVVYDWGLRPFASVESVGTPP